MFNFFDVSTLGSICGSLVSSVYAETCAGGVYIIISLASLSIGMLQFIVKSHSLIRGKAEPYV